MNRPLYEIDRELLALYAKLKAADNVVVRHRLITKIDQLLDERNKFAR